MSKKRINIYVDEELYKRFKYICGLTGETVTSVIDESMRQYVDSIEMILEAGDKDKLMELIQKKVSLQMQSIEKEIDERIKTQK